MKKNIAFISLKSKFCKNVCKMFCDKLEMLYADFNDILQYNLVDQNMLNTAGLSYFEAEEQKVLKNIVTCENVAINIDFNILSKDDNNLKLVKDNCLIIYLKFTKEMLEKLNAKKSQQHTKLIVAYNEEDKVCSSFCDIVVQATGNTQKDCGKIISCIKNYYNI